MADEFINPFHFVPIGPPPAGDGLPVPPDADPGRAKWRPPDPVTHARYVNGTYSGTIRCRLTTETPTVIGAARTPRTPTEAQPPGAPADVAPYTTPDTPPGEPPAGEPAIPASTLRGMVGAVYEAATNSALRVLADELYSVRVPADPGQPLPHLGLIRPGGVQPLDLARKRKVKGYRKRTPDELEVEPRSFLDRENPDSTSAANPDPWYVAANGNPAAAEPSKSAAHKTDIKGVVRVLGIGGREKHLPPGRTKELFAPFAGDDTLPITPAAWETFRILADERTAESVERGGPLLPFHVKGAQRNGADDPADQRLRPQVGDLVFFRTGRTERGEETVTELAVSQVWRRAVGRSFDYFRAVSKELLPFARERETVTLAERVFGYVENLGEAKAKDRQGLALASRVRFSDATLTGGQSRPFFRYEGGRPQAFILQELSTPKPPCPALYFTPKDGTPPGRLIPKIGLNSARHKPHGRKFYVHHPPTPDLAPATGLPPWATRDEDAGAKQRKSRVTPLGSGVTFEFRIDFDNLTDRELGFLLYALRPTAAFRSRVGMGKPLGLGRVRVDIDGLDLVDRAKRYGEHDPFTAPRHLAPDAAVVGGLVDGVRTDARLKAQFEAVERLGDPANTTAAVEYPRIAETDRSRGGPEWERELYEWFVANEKHADPGRRKALAPLTGSGPLPKLPRHPRHRGNH